MRKNLVNMEAKESRMLEPPELENSLDFCNNLHTDEMVYEDMVIDLEDKQAEDPAGFSKLDELNMALTWQKDADIDAAYNILYAVSQQFRWFSEKEGDPCRQVLFRH
eukprot:GHVO01005295.1.p2 GENE.GHVO01005295.1~~GHVO01005295.1.p2  ORF type:complete len:107 (-),score=17.89 GHVO01005295.1:617-937(-)